MVNTGYISFIVKTGGGFDTDRNPLEPTDTPSDYIPCNLAVVMKEYKLLVDQQYQNSSYKVVIDNWVIKDLLGDINIRAYLSALTQIQLQDANSNDLGIFQIQNKGFLDLVQRFKIVV